MFQAWDMLAGRQRPDLGGSEKYLDIIGVNYYPNNQWLWGETSFHPERWLEVGDPQYRPFSDLLCEVYDRYRRPIFVAETGAESDARAGWLRYVGNEVRVALKLGVPIEGICLYPIVDFPGWGDDRHCETGLWGYADPAGQRKLYLPLAQELYCQQQAMAQVTSPSRGGLPPGRGVGLPIPAGGSPPLNDHCSSDVSRARYRASKRHALSLTKLLLSGSPGPCVLRSKVSTSPVR